jgi:hypothetical protein
MKKYILSALLIGLLTLASCVRSLYPITEDEKEMIFKKELLGHWKDKDGSQYFIDTVTGSGGKTYLARLIDATRSNSAKTQFSDTSYFLVVLVNINGKFFLDCSAEMEQLSSKKMGESAAYSLLPTHFILRVYSIAQNSIEMASIEKDAFSSLTDQKKINIRHEMIDKDDILLTERPKILQQKLTALEKFSSVYKRENLARAGDN